MLTVTGCNSPGKARVPTTNLIRLESFDIKTHTAQCGSNLKLRLVIPSG